MLDSKPANKKSIKPDDKRKISLLNSDFKIITSLKSSRHSKIVDHTVSVSQYAVGSNKRIHHTVAMIRDVIYYNQRNNNKGGAILNLDFKMAFDLITLQWIFKVLKKKIFYNTNLIYTTVYHSDSFF